MRSSTCAGAGLDAAFARSIAFTVHETSSVLGWGHFDFGAAGTVAGANFGPPGC